MKFSIVVPCYNEAKNIPGVLGGFSRVFGENNRRGFAELIIVDNNSKDNTAEVLKRELAKPEYAFARTVFEPKPGYGAAIKKGLKEARGEALAWTHGDIQTDPGDVFRAYDIFLHEKSSKLIVKGSRVARSLSQVVFSFGMATVASVVLGKLFFEINAQPKLFSGTFLNIVKNGPDDFSLDLYLLYQAKKKGYLIKTIDVRFRERIHGESKWAASFSSRARTILRTIRYIFKLRKSK